MNGISLKHHWTVDGTGSKMTFYAQFICYFLEFLAIVSYHGQGSVKDSIYILRYACSIVSTCLFGIDMAME